MSTIMNERFSRGNSYFQPSIPLVHQQTHQSQQPKTSQDDIIKNPYSRTLDHLILAATLFESTSYLINGFICSLIERIISAIIGYIAFGLMCILYVGLKNNCEVTGKKIQYLATSVLIITWTTSLFNAYTDKDMNLFLLLPILAFKAFLFIHYSASLVLIMLMILAATIYGIVETALFHENGTLFEYINGIAFCLLTISFLLIFQKKPKKQELEVTAHPPPVELKFDERALSIFNVSEDAVVIVNSLGHPIYCSPSFDTMFPPQKEDDFLESRRDFQPKHPLVSQFQKIVNLKAKEADLQGRITDLLRTEQTLTPKQSDSVVKRILRISESPDSLVSCDRESNLSSMYVTLLNSQRTLMANNIGFDSKARVPKFETFSAVLRKGLKDSHEIDLHVSYMELVNNTFMCLVFHSKQQIEELKTAQKEAEYRKQVLRYVAHDMRNPIGSNQLLLEAAENDIEMSSNMRETYIKPCLKSLKLLSVLVNDLVDSAQITAGKFKLVITEVHIREVIDDVFKIFEMKAKAKDISLNRLLDARLPATIFTDGARLTQILVNLVSNSLKYTPRRGAITIKVDTDILNLNKIHFSVEDTGIGIRMEDQKDLLKDFSKVEGSKDPELNPYGVGLGLSISNKLAAQLNFEGLQDGIKIDSIAGRGTKMRFSVENRRNDSSLKVPSGILNMQKKASENYSGSLEENSNSSSSYESKNLSVKFGSEAQRVKKTMSFLRKIHEEDIVQKPQKNLKKAFIIDDDTFSTDSLATLLKVLGFTVEKAQNTKEALKKLIANYNSINKTGFDLIFVDGMMEDMDGFESAKLLKEKMKNGEIKIAPIVFCTGLDADSEPKAKEAGASYFVTKPITKAILSKILNETGIGQ